MNDDSLVMTSPAEVAERDGVSRQAVTKTVRHLAESQDLPVERDVRGRITRFSLAHYDHHRGQFASSARTNASRQKRTDETAAAPASQSRDEALRREAWLKVGREELRRQEALGQLVRSDQVRGAMTIAGREIQNAVARLPNRADDMALAVSKEGVHGLRVLLRSIAFDLNTEIADRLAATASDAADGDPLIEEETG